MEALARQGRMGADDIAPGRGGVRRRRAITSMPGGLRAEMTAPGMGRARGPAERTQRRRAAGRRSTIDRPGRPYRATAPGLAPCAGPRPHHATPGPLAVLNVFL